MRYYTAVAVCFLILNSCSKTRENTEDTFSKDVDVFTTYTIDSEIPSASFSDLIDQVEIMRLEETDQSLLSNIAFLGHSDQGYVLTSWSNSDIHVFSETGEFVRKINHRGEGPQEYRGISNFWASNNLLGISGGGYIVEYDWEGNFINKRKNPHRSFHIYPYLNGYVMDMSQSRFEEGDHYSAITVDSSLLITSKQIPSTYHEIGLYGANSFSSYKNSVVYHDPFMDTVYLFENEQARPLFSLNFGEKWVWKNESLRTDIEKHSQLRKSEDAVWVFTPYVGEEYILVNCRNSPQYIFIDRNQAEVVKVDLPLANHIPLGLRPIQWEGERFVMYLPSTEVALFLEGLAEDQKTFRAGTTLEEIESSENPVLMWVKFR